MKHRILLALIIALCTMLSACSSGHDREERTYEEYKVKVDTYLNVRDQPSKSGRIVGYLYNNTQVQVIDSYGGWARVQGGGVSGYVSTDYLVPVVAPQPEVAVVEHQEVPKPEPPKQTPPQKPQPQKQKPEPQPEPEPDETEGENVSQGQSGVFDDMALEVAVIPTVDPGNVFGIADQVNDSVMNVRYGIDKMGWFKRMWRSFSSTDEHYTVVYVQSCHLLAVGGTGITRKVLELVKSEEYFQVQQMALTDPDGAIQRMVELVCESKVYASEMGWFKRTGLISESPLTAVADDIFLQNILPSDSWLYRYVFRWLFYLPLTFAIGMVDLFGSFPIGFAVVWLLSVGVFYAAIKIGQNSRSDWAKIGITILEYFMMAVMICTVVYVVPDMTNALAMQLNGYSLETVANVIKQYSHVEVERNWLMIVMFIIGYIGAKCINAPSLAGTFLPDYKQRIIYRNIKNNGTVYSVFRLGYNESKYNELLNEDAPLSEIFGEYFAHHLGSGTIIILACPFILNGYLLLFLTAFLWKSVVTNAIATIYLYGQFKHVR